MSVVAKFFLAQITQTTNGSTIKMHPVCRGEENKSWSAFTPSGTLEMAVLNPAAAEFFTVGQEYMLTFTEAAEG